MLWFQTVWKHADPGEASVAGGHLYKVMKIDDAEVSILIPWM